MALGGRLIRRWHANSFGSLLLYLIADAMEDNIQERGDDDDKDVSHCENRVMTALDDDDSAKKWKK